MTFRVRYVLLAVVLGVASLVLAPTMLTVASSEIVEGEDACEERWEIHDRRTGRPLQAPRVAARKLPPCMPRRTFVLPSVTELISAHSVARFSVRRLI